MSWAITIKSKSCFVKEKTDPIDLEMKGGRGERKRGDKFPRKNTGAHLKDDLTFIVL